MIPGCPDIRDATLDAETSDEEAPAVQCGQNPPQFPVFDRTCEKDADCVVVLHQVNCCGTEVAWGIAASEKAAFDAAESECRSEYPACGCPALPTQADDGNTGSDFGVRCRNGECFSFVKGLVPRCHDQKDCEPFETCLAPGEPAPCGICRHLEPECASDHDCPANTVCEWVTGSCLCEPVHRCIPRCDLPIASPLPPCAAGFVCDASGHCIEQPCGAPGPLECPMFFFCAPDSGVCRRVSCANDADCAGGFCVEGLCYDALGTCMPIPP